MRLENIVGMTDIVVTLMLSLTTAGPLLSYLTRQVVLAQPARGLNTTSSFYFAGAAGSLTVGLWGCTPGNDP